MTDQYYEESYPPSVWGGGAPPPTLTTLAPASIVVDVVTPVTITGTGFTTGARVVVDGVTQPTTFVSATQVTYNAHASDVGAQDVWVDQTGHHSNQLVLTVTATVVEEEPAVESARALPDDVATFTIPEVQAWVTDNPDQASAVLAAEQARGDSARVTLVAWLQALPGASGEPA